MKKLFSIGLFIALSTNLDAFNLNPSTNTFKAGQACGDCGGQCGKPEKPDVA